MLRQQVCTFDRFDFDGEKELLDSSTYLSYLVPLVTGISRDLTQRDTSASFGGWLH